MMTSFQTSGTAHSRYVYCFIYKCMRVCVCACIRNSHIDSRPVEHQLSNFIVICIYTYIYALYTDPNISSPSSVRFPTGANICSPISKRDHDPRPNPPLGVFTPHCFFITVGVAGRRFKTNNGQTAPLFPLYYIHIF